MQAIETAYNGYRFRSRLEAKWAVYFDRAGIKYEYEPQGFQFDDGTRYLPDFYLPAYGIYLETKFEGCKPVKDLPRVYLAGKMGDVERTSWRPFSIWLNDEVSSPFYDFSKQPGALVARRTLFSAPIWYCGPWQGSVDGHGLEHGVATSGGACKAILNNALAGIRECDVFFAMLNDRTAYGTLAEIGYAKALGKTVCIGVGDDVVDREFYPNRHFSWHGGGKRWVNLAEPAVSDFWFALSMADHLFSDQGEEEDTFIEFEQFLRDCYLGASPRKEDVAFWEFAARDTPYVVAYGDPAAAKFVSNACIRWDWYKPASDAARQARAARFEHGARP